MKTISDYTIYCTSEQTKKALELGAPLFRLYGTGCSDYIDMLIISDTEAYTIPTAEQMIGWLEEQGFNFEATKIYTVLEHNKSGVLGFYEGVRKEAAILVAIDAALEYLTNNKK